MKNEERNRATTTITLPLATTHWATLQARFPLTPEEWNALNRLLETMRPALVEGDGTVFTPAPVMYQQHEDCPK